MIVIDTSAVIAILQREAESASFIASMQEAAGCLMSAATYLECAMVAESRRGMRSEFDRWLESMEIDVVAVDFPQARIAADAFARFGRGRHPARLNYGDCFAYALANSLDAPLLYKGDDFDKTDIRPALVTKR